MHVVFPTTPAQYFHLLRRQMKRNFRKPLIIAGPKGLLRHPVRNFIFVQRPTYSFVWWHQAATSTLSEMETGTQFQPVLDDPFIKDPSTVERVSFVTGKFYYELAKARQDMPDQTAAQKIAFIRIEELCPFPYARLREVAGRYRNANWRDVYWEQEEPANQGAWPYVEKRIITALASLVGPDTTLHYRGRGYSPMPAPGSARVYKEEQAKLAHGKFVNISHSMNQALE